MKRLFCVKHRDGAVMKEMFDSKMDAKTYRNELNKTYGAGQYHIIRAPDHMAKQ